MLVKPGFGRKQSEHAVSRELASSFYNTMIDPDAWQPELEKLAEMLKSQASAIARYDFETGSGYICRSIGIAPAYIQLYDDALSDRNVWMADQSRYCAPGSILTDKDLIVEKGLLDSDFYNAWMRPQGLFHRVCLVLENDDGKIIYFVAYRARAAGPYTARELRNLDLLFPHLRRSLQVYQRFARLQEERNAAVEALNVLPLSVMVVDGKAKLLAANRRANALLNQNNGIRVVGGAIHVPDGRAMAALLELIAGATRGGGNKGTETEAEGHSGHSLLLPRASGARPLSITVMPLSLDNHSFEWEEPAAVLYIGEPERQVGANIELIHQMYGLTPTESRLTRLLARGDSIAEAASALGVSVGTARIHLKHIFSKTGTSRQAELVSLVLNEAMRLEET